MDAREVAIIITGAHKALALAKCIEEGNLYFIKIFSISLVKEKFCVNSTMTNQV
jgi:hypothetical protein